jgi:type II secretory pathway pseudopilin PulG
MKTRLGFTLVEMLVAVTVVIVMMTLFATIFQLATQSMAVQKGLAENDQRVRLVEALLRTDLNSQTVDKDTNLKRPQRTFRLLIPWGAKEDLGLRVINPWTPGTAALDSDRSGYFYISENNPNDDTDDVLQLTVSIPATMSERYYGKAAALLPDANNNYGNPPPAAPPTPSNGAATANYWADQPEFDDVYGMPNQTGSSTRAEVSYFLRNGTLYRRIMLIREPNVITTLTNDHTPEDDAQNALSFTAYTSANGRNFWTDFDYSTYFNGITVDFLGDLSMNEAGGSINTLLSPAFRWGFDCTSNPGAGYGLPREFAGTTFIGRFTHAETSDPTFGYPARMPNPMTNTFALTVSNGQVTNFPNGTRGGEDVLMSNVIAFDIKVWDPAASLGPDGQPGLALNPNGPPGTPFDDDGNGIANDANEIGFWGTDDGAWVDIGHPGFLFNGARYGFYRAPLDATGNPIPAALANPYYSNPFATPPTNRFDTWGPFVSVNGTSTPPTSYDSPPYRPLYFGPDGKPGQPNIDDDGNGFTDFLANGAPDPAELGFTGTDDFAALTAIKITIRFYDVTSNQVRDVTEVYGLAPK